MLTTKIPAKGGETQSARRPPAALVPPAALARGATLRGAPPRRFSAGAGGLGWGGGRRLPATSRAASSPSGAAAAAAATAALHAPVEVAVVLNFRPHRQVLEEAAQVGVVGLIGEAQSPAVLEVDAELVREALAQKVDGRGHLLLHDLLVLLLLRVRPQTLPRQRPAQEVEEDVAQGLKVVAAALLDAQMVVDRGITRRTGQVLVLAVHDVHVRLRVPVPLRQAEINDVDHVGAAAQPDQEVVGLDVAVDEVLRMDVLHAVDHLVRQHADRLHAELPIAEAEQILEGRPQQVDDHHVVVPLDPVPVDVRNAHAPRKDLVELGLVEELGVPRLDGLELDRNLFTRLDVRPNVDVSEGTRPNLPPQPELTTHAQLHR
mmetsp:Transcript_164025/g.398635  ORF Transcript_164025/g.398635 Transcript_164025/m.398635 type:complete len:375 (+) Transcript_164025:167-1291(+)